MYTTILWIITLSLIGFTLLDLTYIQMILVICFHYISFFVVIIMKYKHKQGYDNEQSWESYELKRIRKELSRDRELLKDMGGTK